MNKSKVSIRPNAQQKLVLDHKDGPLLVVAGAGTGKTRVIVDKIAHLLSSGVSPAAILAVTFTEKAATEMLDRVLETQDGFLLDLQIKTFNGCGDSILSEFGIDIGIPKSFSLLTSQAAIVFVRERFDLLNLDYYYPAAGSPDGVIADLLSYFSKLKQHLVTPKSYQVYTEKLTSNDDAEIQEKNKHTELAGAFEKYISLCREANVIDFDDQIYLSVELLEKRQNVRRILQQRYHTIFVDEFQDTNPMQSRLIDLLLPQSRNLIVVGDDDQAIYGFRGATISNILNFKPNYPDAAETTLTENYRSHQSILDAAYKLIQNNNPHRLEAQLGLNKKLTSKKPGNIPQFLHFENSRSELDWLASDVVRRLKQLKKDELPSIAVLTRSNNGAQAVHQALTALDVPHRVVGLNPSLYEQPIVRTLLELNRTLVDPGNNTSLHHTLVSKLFEINNSDISELSSKASREHDNLEDILSEIQQTKKAIKLIRNLRSSSASEPVGQLLWRACSESGLTDRLLSRANDDDSAANALGHLSQFFDTLKQFESIATQPTAIQYQLALPALMAAGETSDDTLGLNESDVIVTTVHKAKGLEWNTVYLPQLTMQKFPMYEIASGIKVPDLLRAEGTNDADEHYQEERRVMYVAITRARQNLVFTYSDGTRKPSIFLNEIFGEETVASTPYTETKSDQSHIIIASDKTPKIVVPSRIFDGEVVSLDVTRAQTLLNCPLNFYYKYVIGMPSEPSASAQIGTQMHGYIEEINIARRDGKPLRSLAEMTEELERSWGKSGYHSKNQRDQRLKIAKTSLANFYNYAVTNPAPVQVEEKFKVNLADDVVLYGRIDAVFENDGIEIRDYKTGFAAKTQDKAQKNVSDSRQLELYALAWLIDHDEMPAKLSLHYIDTNLVGSTTRKQQKTLESRHQNLIDAAHDLMQGIFPPGRSHRYCEHPEL